MKIYFTAAVSNVPSDIRSNYDLIIQTIEKLGHTVLASHLSGKDESVIRHQDEKEALAVQRKMTAWKKQADLVIVEGSVPSFGVGQEISEALTENKQVIVLHVSGRKPHILAVQGESSLYVVEYSESNLKNVLDEYIEYARSRSDTRFNFFISPQIGAYLDWVAKKKRLPRAVYLRRLIESEMKDNKEYAQDA